MSRLYAQVIVPRPVDGIFTYEIPSSLHDRVSAGRRVVVPFGPKRFVTGIVEAVTPIRPEGDGMLKEVTEAADIAPTAIHPQIKLWHWLADYYMCPIGDVYKAAVPAGLRVESESLVEVSPEISDSFASLDEHELAIVTAIRDKGKVAVKDIERSAGITPAAISRMVDRGILVMHESMVSKYRSRKVQYVSLALARGDADAIAAAFKAVRRSPAQEAALIALMSLSGFTNPTLPLKAVERTSLLNAAPAATWEAVTALRRKGLVEIEVREVSRFSYDDDPSATTQLPELSDDQRRALSGIHSSFTDKAVTLLHGVTSSGKTEIYIHLIDFVLRQQKQALFLVPEIALTTQLTRRLQHVFGRKVRIYHSKFSDNERVDIWRDMISSPEPCVVIGARSAIFLPFTNLGLVIVDEEHDPSYKQTDPSPRYNARDTAIVLASFHGAKTLLGSATPSVETYYKATEGAKYGLVTLDKRFGDAGLPAIEIVDMSRERSKGDVDGAFANHTVAEGRHTLNDGRQMIVFHNRRGFSPRARCTQCQFIPKCDHCDVSLTYHKRTNTLECHYCGAVYPLPKTCPNCHEPAIRIEGYGTERVEDDVAALFPEASILRMDLDTTRNKEAYSTIIDDFSAGKAQILVGTQMVTKGLDFGSVGLVAVMNADNILNYPDYRSTERAFNLLEQVAGRAGRRKVAEGKVIIQTYTPDHPVIGHVLRHDYLGFYNEEIELRRRYMYPPFARVIMIYVKHRDRATVIKMAAELTSSLRALLGNRVQGPIEPPVERVASQYIRRIMLRIENTASPAKVKQLLRGEYIRLQSSPLMKGLSIYYDVDFIG